MNNALLAHMAIKIPWPKKKIDYKNMTHHLNKEEPFMAYIMVFKGERKPYQK
jgi:hypothetical protein